MPHWLLKSALHRAASLLPGREAWHRLLQRASGSLVLTPERFVEKVAEARRHYDLFRKHARGENRDFTALELGTGWHPIIPLALSLCGATTVWTYDIEPLVERTALGRTLELFIAAADAGRLDALLPAWQKTRLEALRALVREVGARAPAEALARVGIELCVQDVRSCGLADASVDFAMSSGVLMILPRALIAEIFGEFRRVCRPGAVMVHRVNFRDTFSAFDCSISVFNMLRFSPAAWRWLDSAAVPQNRLRVSDQRALLAEAGFALVEEQNESAPIEELRRVPLAPEFRGYSEDDLRVVESWLVSMPR